MGEGLKNNLKKYLPYIVGVAAVVIVIILAVSLFTGGPKKAVKNFVKGMNKQKASKVMKSVDLKGIQAWTSGGEGYFSYGYDVDDFEEEDYEEFLENYADIDDKDIEEAAKEYEDSLDDNFDDMDDNYKSYKLKVEEFKSVDKLAKDLYVVKAKISVKAKPDDDDVDEIDESTVLEFVVYKNKIISMPLF